MRKYRVSPHGGRGGILPPQSTYAHKPCVFDIMSCTCDTNYMHDVTHLHVLSRDDGTISFLQAALEKLRVRIITASSPAEFFSQCQKHAPHIFLIDDATCDKKPTGTYDVLKECFTQYKHSIATAILISDDISTEQRIEYLLRGADYILMRPINIMEIIARVSAVVHFQQRIKTVLNYERGAGVMDKMENIVSYLAKHVKAPIQRFIDYDVSDNSREYLEKYTRIARQGAVNVIAAVNAIRDEAHTLMRSHHGSHEEFHTTLDDLFKKHLTIVSAAYDIDEVPEEGETPATSVAKDNSKKKETKNKSK